MEMSKKEERNSSLTKLWHKNKRKKVPMDIKHFLPRTLKIVLCSEAFKPLRLIKSLKENLLFCQEKTLKRVSKKYTVYLDPPFLLCHLVKKSSFFKSQLLKYWICCGQKECL